MGDALRERDLDRLLEAAGDGDRDATSARGELGVGLAGADRWRAGDAGSSSSSPTSPTFVALMGLAGGELRRLLSLPIDLERLRLSCTTPSSPDCERGLASAGDLGEERGDRTLLCFGDGERLPALDLDGLGLLEPISTGSGLSGASVCCIVSGLCGSATRCDI